MTPVITRIDLEGSCIKGNQLSRGSLWHMRYLLGKNKNIHTRKQIYNSRGTLRIQSQIKGSRKKSEGREMN